MESIFDIVLANAAGATVLAVIAAVGERFLGRRPALAHGLWLLVLLRLLVPPVWTPEITLTVPGATVADLVESQVAGTLTLPLPAAVVAPMAAMRDTEASGGPWILMIALWLAVSGALALVTGIAIWRLRDSCRRAEPVETALATRWRELATRLEILTPPPLCSVPERTAPMLVSIVGWSRVLVPAALWQRLSASERDTLLLHELAHWKRRDHWVRHVELIALTLFWWHPAAWWASWRLRRAEERACDALVADILPEHRRAYADGLIETMRYLAGGRSATCALASGIRVANDLKGRIEMIFAGYRPSTLPKVVQLALGAGLVAVLALTPVLTTSTASASATISENEIFVVTKSFSANEDFSGATISFTGDKVGLIEPLRRLAEVSGLNIVVEPGVDVSARMLVDLDSVPWDQALAELLAANNLTYTLEDAVLWVHRPGTRREEIHFYTGEPIDLHLEQADVRQVLADLGAYTDMELVIDEGVLGTIDLHLNDVPWDHALDIVLRVSNLDMSVENGVLRVMGGC